MAHPGGRPTKYDPVVHIPLIEEFMAHPGGRPTKYDPVVHIPLIEELAGQGTTLAQMAAALDISLATLKTWKDKYPEFLAALKVGKDATDDRVERSLYERAMGYNHEAVKIMVVAGKPELIPYIEHYPPDATSLIFWLKNRRPKEWRDRQEIEHSGSLEPVQDMTPDDRRALIASLLVKRNTD